MENLVYIWMEPTFNGKLTLNRIVPNAGMLQRIYGFLASKEWHTTIMYSPDTTVEFASKRYRLKAASTLARLRPIEIWDSKEGNHPMVIPLESRDLHRRHRYWEKLGLKSTYPEFKPHLTLCYDVRPEHMEHARKIRDFINKEIAKGVSVRFGRENILVERPKLQTADPYADRMPRVPKPTRPISNDPSMDQVPSVRKLRTRPAPKDEDAEQVVDSAEERMRRHGFDPLAEPFNLQALKDHYHL